jgi:peptidoglycan/xylan/chitin deacetylase (PgdA/CDA1 family)
MLTYCALAVVTLLAGAVLFCIGYVLYAAFQEYRPDRVPALLYHQIISKEKLDRGEIVNQERVYVAYDSSFAEQMEYLHRQGYTTIALEDLLAFQEGKRPLPSKPIILTFDDGFMSNYLYAFPILKRYGMKATIFVTPDRESLNFKKYAHVDAPLSPEQIQEMSEYGISIESHGMTHRYLTELSPHVTRWELEESRKVLESTTNKPVRFLAVPSGAYNRLVKRLAKECGYEAVFCMLKGSNNKGSDRYALRRLVVARDVTLGDFHSLLSPATAIRLRLMSCAQNILLHVLGPSGLDKLRNSLYRSPFIWALASGKMR